MTRFVGAAALCRMFRLDFGLLGPVCAFWRRFYEGIRVTYTNAHTLWFQQSAPCILLYFTSLGALLGVRVIFRRYFLTSLERLCFKKCEYVLNFSTQFIELLSVVMLFLPCVSLSMSLAQAMISFGPQVAAGMSRAAPTPEHARYTMLRCSLLGGRIGATALHCYS